MKRLKELISIRDNKDYDNMTISLRDMEYVTADKVDYSYIVYRILGYKDSWLDKYIFKSKELKRAYKKAIEITNEARSLKPNHLRYENDSEIKSPASVDYISFVAMMELNAIIGQGVVTTMSDLMSHIITIVCYSENYKGKDYDSNGIAFKSLQHKVKEAPLDQMLALYNWIMKSLDESNRVWSNRFSEVAVIDEDYDMVGGAEKQAPYNVINTIKILCNDFNVTYKEAWQLSFAVTQTNSLAKATASFIQDEMRQVMEKRMEAKRKRNRG